MTPPLNTPPSISGPTDSVAVADPGADTARRFRYQYAYALIILIRGALVGKRFRAIWCEQHEDLLAERVDGKFDAYQIKTQKPEAGPIECATPSLVHSIVRFSQHEEKYGAHIARYVFVSNTAEIVTNSPAQDHRSLSKLLAALKVRRRNPVARKAWANLLSDTKLPPTKLRAVLTKFEFIKGPAYDGTNDALHRMLHELDACTGWAAYRIVQLRDYLLSKVLQASSLGGEDPERFYIALTEPDHPLLQNKRMTPEHVVSSLRDFGGSFRYLPGTGTIHPGSEKVGRVLRQKMQHAGLDYYFDSLQRKAVSVEQEFFALFHRGREADATQLECIVKDVCDRARLDAELTEAKFGKLMHAKLTTALEQLARNEPAKVQHRSAEFLAGVAGLLAENCQLWWSEKFELKDSS